MTFKYFVDKEEKAKKLDTFQEEEVVKSIVSDFTSFHKARKENFDKAKRLEDEIFFRTEIIQSGEDDNKDPESWKTKAKMCKTYMFYCTLLAFIWKNVYQSVSSMFDVSGENQESDNVANKQKAMLVDIFEKMEFTKSFDKMVRYFMIYGEIISYSAWSKQYQEVRRPITLDTEVKKLPQVIAAKLRGENFYTDLKKIYDNPKVYAVNPADFVYDVSQEDNFDAAPKIYRSWKTPDEIINNKFYQIDKETRDELKELVANFLDSSQYPLKLERFTKVGNSKISYDGIVSGFDEGAALKQNTEVLPTPQQSVKIIAKFSSSGIYNGHAGCIYNLRKKDTTDDSNLLTSITIPNNSMRLDCYGGQDNHMLNVLEFTPNKKYKTVEEFTRTTRTISIYDENNNLLKSSSIAITGTIALTNLVVQIGGFLTIQAFRNGSIDLNEFKIYVDNKFVYEALSDDVYIGDVTVSNGKITAVKNNYFNACPARRDLVDSYQSGASYYAIYSDGWCIQGGNCTNGTAITLLKAYKDVNYVVSTTYSTKTASGFTPTQSGTWEAKGYL